MSASYLASDRTICSAISTMRRTRVWIIPHLRDDRPRSGQGRMIQSIMHPRRDMLGDALGPRLTVCTGLWCGVEKLTGNPQ